MPNPIRKIYFKADFQVILSSEAGWTVPFRLAFYTNSPSRPFVATYDGTTYTNCSITNDDRLQVAFDDHGLGLGNLMVEMRFYLTNAAYLSGICDEVIAPQQVTATETVDGVSTTYDLVLSLEGASTLTTVGTLPAYYQQGPQGASGATGATGPAGTNGTDGVSPTVTTSKEGTVTTITIVDATGTHTATINDGADGQDGTNGQDGTDGQDGADGQDGQDGVSPTVSISKTGTVTTIIITDATGSHTATINDGAEGPRSEYAESDHSTATSDHTTAASDHEDVQDALDDLEEMEATFIQFEEVEDVSPDPQWNDARLAQDESRIAVLEAARVLIESTLNSQGARITLNESAITQLSQTLSIVQAALTSEQSARVAADSAESSARSAADTALAADIISMESEIDTLQDSVTSHSSSITTIEADLASKDAAITANATAIATNTSNIASSAATIAEHTSSISTLATDLDALEAAAAYYEVISTF